MPVQRLKTQISTSLVSLEQRKLSAGIISKEVEVDSEIEFSLKTQSVLPPSSSSFSMTQT